MLALLNIFIHPSNQIVLDRETEKGYLLIQKCGTQSLIELTERLPHRFRLVDSTEFLETGIGTLTVFIREPIGRYLSGINTQMKIHGIPDSYFKQVLKDIIPMIDAHTMPQFWFLLRFGLDTKLRFEIAGINDIQKVHPSIGHLNVQTGSVDFFDDGSLARVAHVMTEDIVLYNQFMGRTTTISEVLSQVTKEGDFFNDVSKYSNLVPYMGNV